MPHYSDGERAAPGDLVIGTGYNIPVPIVGVVVGVDESAEQCNIRVAHVIAQPHELVPEWQRQVGFVHVLPSGQSLWITSNVEYGQADQFKKVR